MESLIGLGREIVGNCAINVVEFVRTKSDMTGTNLILKVLAASVMTSGFGLGFDFRTATAAPSGTPVRPSLYWAGDFRVFADSEQNDTRDQSRSNRGVTLTPKSRAISAGKALRILKTTKYSLDPELSSQTLSEAFDLADGRVLLLFGNGTGRLYESKNELQAMLDEVERRAARGPQSICHDFPQGQVFAEQVPQLVRLLAVQLNLDASQLDGSEASLDKVDKALRRMNPERALTPDVLAPLTAYVGEVLRKATNGRWEMRRGVDVDKTWEPWIVDPSGRRCAPFLIYKELLEYGKSASLRGWVAGTLATWQLREPQPGSPLL